MTWSLRLALWLRRLFTSDTRRALQRVREAEFARDADARAQLDTPARNARRVLQSGELSVCFGSSVDAAGRPFSEMVPQSEVCSSHGFVTGATGSGKSFLVLGLILQLIRQCRGALIIIDMKGELAGLLRREWLPARAASLSDDALAEFIRSINVIAPFDENATPPFQILARDERLPIEVQAHEVATSFGRTIGSDLGPLQQTEFRNVLMLAIDLGLTFPDAVELVRDPELLRAAVARSTLADIGRLFPERNGRERSTSRAGLIARLDSIIMHPALRRMLNAPGMLRFDHLLEGGITIVDLGGAPVGMSDISRFFGQLLFGKLVRAIFSRRVGPNTLPALIFADEFQQLLMPEVAREMERVLTLARSQKVFLWAMFQQVGQIEAAAPMLLRILRNNTNIQVLMRSELDDARSLAHVLPTTGTVRRERESFPDPRNPEPALTHDEERRILLEQIPSMPDRMAWLWARRLPHPAVLLKSPTLDPAAAHRQAMSLEPELRELIIRGMLALDREELDVVEARHRAYRQELLQPAPESRRRPVDALSGSPQLRDVFNDPEYSGDNSDVEEDGAGPSAPPRRQNRCRMRLG